MKNKKYIAGIFIFQVIICILFSKSYALDPQTHKDLNQYIAKSTIDGFSLDSYLRDQLGFQVGVDEGFNSLEVWQWVSDGGYYEDKPPKFIPYVRSFKHYHNPLTDQGYAGLESSVQWSQKPIGSQSPIGWSGNYSWYDVRDYFYSALIATDQTTRDGNFAETFRGLGQLMHLVQDLSVPAHTRNDAHIFFYNYEDWVYNKVKYNESQNIDNISVYQPFTSFDKSAIGNVNSLASVPVANLFDTNQYILSSPDPSKTLQSNIGLSEYTNANFLSSGTIPGTIFDGDFPYPILANHLFGGSCELQYFDIEDPRNPTQTVRRPYWVKAAHGANGYRLSTFPYLARSIFGLETFKTVSLDDYVYKDYGQKLIPRAVGYSAGLLDYFFRGKLEIEAPAGFVYSIIDGSVVDGSYEIDGTTIQTQTFKQIKAKVKNVNPNEVMQNGQLIAIAKYKRRNDYQPDLSSGVPNPTSMENDFSYSVSEPTDIQTLNPNDSQEFIFDFSQSPIPVSVTDLYLQVVFKGTLGNEANCAIAVGMKDLNEPMHITFINSTDRFYLDGVLHTADEIRADPELLERVDLDGDGTIEWWLEEPDKEPYIDPFNISVGIGFSRDLQQSWTWYYNPLPPGSYGRIIILTEPVTDPPEFHMFVHNEATEPLESIETDYPLTGVTNQWVVDPDTGESYFPDPTPLWMFRNAVQHEFHTRIIYYPDPTGIYEAPWPDLTLVPFAP